MIGSGGFCAPPGAAASRSAARRLRVVLVAHALGGTAVALELRLDPVDRLAVTRRALAAIAKGGQALDCGFVFLEIEASDQRADRIGGRWRCRLLCFEGNCAKCECQTQEKAFHVVIIQKWQFPSEHRLTSVRFSSKVLRTSPTAMGSQTFLNANPPDQSKRRVFWRRRHHPPLALRACRGYAHVLR